MDDIRDRENRNAVLIRKCAERSIARSMAAANCPHIIFGQLGAAIDGTAFDAILCGNPSHLVNVTSFDVLPSNAANDTADGFTAHAEPIRNLLLRDTSRRIQRPDVRNSISGEDGTGDTFATRSTLRLRPRTMQRTGSGVEPSLVFGVVDVDGVRAKEEVGGIAARRMIAGVTNEQASRIVSGCKKEREAMRLQVLSADFDLTVPIAEPAQSPLPTVVGTSDSDVRPEPLLSALREDRKRLRRVVHGGKYTMMVPQHATDMRGYSVGKAAC